jgi:hypothetical protein
MQGAEFISAVQAVGWSQVQSTYASGEIVRDIVLSLASGEQARVRWAWKQIGQTVLQHQGTVYPATAAAAPFLCQIALDEASLFRAALVTELAFVSCGYDQPYAPAGTALAVRDAVRPSVSPLLRLWGTGGAGFDLGLTALSVAFPADAGIITARMRDWFTRSEPPLRTALGLALGFHGDHGADVKQTVLDEVGQSLGWVTRSGRRIGYVPADSPFPEPRQEPYIDSPVPDAIRIAELLRSGAEEHTRDFGPVFSFLLTLMESGSRTIDWPT